MSYFKKHIKGNISLTLVLVISAVLLSSGIALTLTSINSTYAAKHFRYVSLAEFRAKSCIEESLFKLKTNTSFTGSLTINFSDGNCSSNIQNDISNVNYKTLSITSNINTYYFQLTKTVDISTSPLTVK